MTAELDPMVANARIVTPQEAALDVVEYIAMKAMILAARRDGVEAHVMQFPDDVASNFNSEPNKSESWRKTPCAGVPAAIHGLTAEFNQEQHI